MVEWAEHDFTEVKVAQGSRVWLFWSHMLPEISQMPLRIFFSCTGAPEM